ncbi:MAG: biopolymer transporter ExbD [candidate division KSB1 bacterium]|nr:biopolymer transporter ExbD [candidate division KSB1 bacterium]MDZ7302052.1 biopolymer transporter ExbD [candidate division KSB1 bacterium]MDZ7311094.1 biopolymer transporter ExbD [candidate division KSB1 bacterium]
MLKLGKNKASFTIIGNRPKKRPNYDVRLTSLLDMFTILLVFLLKSFSAEGQIITASKDLQLPESTSEKPPRVAPIIAVTKEWIILDDKPLVKVAEINGGGDLLIEPLQQGLLQTRIVAQKLGQVDERFGFHGTVDIMGDRDASFAVIKRVMYTCGQVGFNNMLLAVYKHE